MIHEKKINAVCNAIKNTEWFQKQSIKIQRVLTNSRFLRDIVEYFAQLIQNLKTKKSNVIIKKNLNLKNISFEFKAKKTTTGLRFDIYKIKLKKEYIENILTDLIRDLLELTFKMLLPSNSVKKYETLKNYKFTFYNN